MIQIDYLTSSEIKNIHFIGINGISMSGLAEILIKMGYTLSGSDLKTSARTANLEKMGAKIFDSHHEQNIDSPDLVVYTAAIDAKNPELEKAYRLGIPVISRATLLGQIMKRYAYSVAVSGTHGKSTTSSMVSMILLEAALDPTIHIGAELDAIQGTTQMGASQYFVAEACEYCGSFLEFDPYIAIILNIDFDHADYFKDIGHVKDTFLEFASHVPQNGYVIACRDDENSMEVLQHLDCKKITFGLKHFDDAPADWTAQNIIFNTLGCASFTLIYQGQPLTTLQLSVPGIHNVNNALSAIAAGYALGCNIQIIKSGLEKFKGTKRRFEWKGSKNNIHVIDDYAHHPLEIQATLKAMRNCQYRQLWCIFQPHTYTRTKTLFADFACSFKEIDHVVITDIYAAREPDTGEIHSLTLTHAINEYRAHAVYMNRFEDIVQYLHANATSGDIILTMGAGDVYKIGEMFLEA